MNLTIKPLTPELTSVYLDYFDNRAFADADPNGPCHCTSPMQTSQEIDQMVSEFAGDVKGTIRRYAVKMLSEGKIKGYLAFDGNIPVGWCNATDIDDYVVSRHQFVPDFARENAVGKTISVVCFSVAPEYRGKGISTALLACVVSDAKERRYVAVEGYAHIHDERDDTVDFKGPARLYEKLGFTRVAARGGEVVMRKVF
jgi:GNAT superfamily N-acetyltransferase